MCSTLEIQYLLCNWVSSLYLCNLILFLLNTRTNLLASICKKTNWGEVGLSNTWLHSLRFVWSGRPIFWKKLVFDSYNVNIDFVKYRRKLKGNQECQCFVIMSLHCLETKEMFIFIFFDPNFSFHHKHFSHFLPFSSFFTES